MFIMHIAMKAFHMNPQTARVAEHSTARFALSWLLIRVYRKVIDEKRFQTEGFSTEITSEWLLASVSPKVDS